MLAMSLLFLSRPLEYCGYSGGGGDIIQLAMAWGEVYIHLYTPHSTQSQGKGAVGAV